MAVQRSILFNQNAIINLVQFRGSKVLPNKIVLAGLGHSLSNFFRQDNANAVCAGIGVRMWTCLLYTSDAADE